MRTLECILSIYITMRWLEISESSSEQRWRLFFDDARIHGWSRISRMVILSRADGASRRFIRFLQLFDVRYMAFSWIDVKPLLIWIINRRRRSSDDVHSSRGHKNGSRPIIIPYNTTPLWITLLDKFKYCSKRAFLHIILFLYICYMIYYKIYKMRSLRAQIHQTVSIIFFSF